MTPAACTHLSAAFGSLRPPRPSDQVHREECTLCFDDQDGPDGIDICLLCFNGSCRSADRNHSALHFQKTQHALVANVKRTPKPRTQEEEAQRLQAPTKLAILAEREEDKYEWTYTPRCLACHDTPHGGLLPMTDKLQEVIDGIRKALSSGQQAEVKAWEEEITACQHTRELQQLSDAKPLQATAATCGKCDMTSNLWLCLTCGNLGCGRAQFGGVGGNSHGLAHFEETGHAVCVKQGTITAEGTADIYCYACNDARLDPHLASHLRHLGINVLEQRKTEKSMTELQIEQNISFDFSMTGEDGKQLVPVFGPGLTGLANLGNSCYLASVLQAIFSLPQFRARYGEAYRPHTLGCNNPLPASCLECQTCKVAEGLLSGRYSHPRKSPERPQLAPVSKDDKQEEQPVFQAGIRPAMFKALVGRGHEEFSTMRQQDADEFLKHLVGLLQKDQRRLQGEGLTLSDPTHSFGFRLQTRLQCTECKRVRYVEEAQEAGLSLPVPLRPIEEPEGKAKAPAEGAGSAKASVAPGTTRFEPVNLKECLDIFAAPEALEYRCPACDKHVTATKQTSFTSFPDVLVIQVRRFQLVNWVPQKVNVPVVVPFDGLALDSYIGKGLQEGEEELPDGGSEGDSGGKPAIMFDAGAMAQLTGMGFPEVRCQRALLATGNTGDAEAAMNWLFAHMEDPDIDDPIDLSAAVAPSSGPSASSGPDTSMLEDMGFSAAQARKALRLNGNNPEMAVAWLFENPGDAGDDESAAAGPSDGGAASSEPVKLGRADLPATYRLKAFISHKGPSVHSGHYVAHIRQPQGSGQGEDDWVFFNDEKVVKAPLSSPVGSGEDQSHVGVEGLSKLAYEFFYERV